MKNKKINIYMIGVGGQGIGLLSETLIRAADYANLHVRGVDTHGLAQRGGTVQSHLRIGKDIYSSLIQKGKADIVIALERTEALRGMESYLKDNGTLIYYDTSWQALDVRLENAKEVKNEDITKESQKRNIEVIKVFKGDLEEARMQNVVILGKIAKNEIIEEISDEDYKVALGDLLKGKVLDKNLEVFNEILQQ
ncbi:MAG: 2-oxoacid:acceptor oxidoreductase family protein [Bacillota bacterium]